MSNVFWVLVYVSMLPDGSADAKPLNKFKRMSDCFKSREAVLVAARIPRPYFPKGVQAVCIRTEIAWKHLQK